MATRLATVLIGMAWPLVSEAPGDPPQYLGPCEIVPFKDGAHLFILCRDAEQLLVLNVRDRQVVRKIDCPPKPTGVTISPDGETLYVTGGGPEGFVHFVDTASGRVRASIPVGHTPTGPSVTPDGKSLYVCNRFSGNVSVIDVQAKESVALVPAVREPIASAISPDGKLVLVANHLPQGAADRPSIASALTVINTADHAASTIRLLRGSSSVRDVCVAPDGKYAYAVHILARFQVPTTQLQKGWINTNALSVIDLLAGKLVNTILLDETELGAANPWRVACTDDGASICVTHAGTHELSVIDQRGLLDMLARFASDQNARPDLYSSVLRPSNRHSFLGRLRRRIPLRGQTTPEPPGAESPEPNGPRGVAILGSKAYVAVYFSDQIGVIDLAEDSPRAVSLIQLGPGPQPTSQRLGEMHFHDATLCFQHWQSCATCHPDRRVDGLNWDLLNDGLGNPKNGKSLLLSHVTPPSMSTGIRPNAESAVRSGFKHILFSVPREHVAASVDAYLKSATPLPSPHLERGRLSDTARRGKELFFGRRLDCSRCHPEPHYTDLKMHHVGSRGPLDRQDAFDTPTLIECWRTAPYMHDGHFATLEDLFHVGKHGMRDRDAAELTEQEVDDLVEFVRSL